MSHKLNAEELARKRWPDFVNVYGTKNRTTLTKINIRNGYAAAIREVAQPIADERDELREAIAELHDAALDAREYIAGKRSPNDTLVINLTDCTAKARAILAKYPKP
jgi:hypothetical protein